MFVFILGVILGAAIGFGLSGLIMRGMGSFIIWILSSIFKKD